MYQKPQQCASPNLTVKALVLNKKEIASKNVAAKNVILEPSKERKMVNNFPRFMEHPPARNILQLLKTSHNMHVGIPFS